MDRKTFVSSLQGGYSDTGISWLKISLVGSDFMQSGRYQRSGETSSGWKSDMHSSGETSPRVSVKGRSNYELRLVALLSVQRT